MNLNKLFNYKYLFQNIKKSKMTIALFFILVPVFTSLMIIANTDYTFEFETLGLVNILGMYFIPFIFSICLFGYVYKKNSVDFMGSMPISRKCVFITNTIGGIGLILLIQLVTFFLTLLIGSITKGIVFASMAWDILIFQTIAYVFVFTATNLAMSLSGNLVTQIAVTMLIVFIVPFSTWYVNNMSDGMSGSEYALMNNDIEIMKVSKIENYTAPFLIANNGVYEYNVVSLWKMILLSVVYFGIGYIAFNKRKMEMAGESFENKYVHFIVKGLTLIPFVAILKAMSGYTELSISIIVVSIILVYYIIFDLITSKKIRIWENAIAVVFSIVAIYGIYSIAISINENIDKKLELYSVKTINVNVDDSFYTKMIDKNAMKSFMAILAKSKNNYSYYNDANYNMEITLVKNNGTKFTKMVYLNGKTLQEMFDESYRNEGLGNNAVISNEQIKLTNKESSELLKYINESLKELTLKEILNAKSNINYADVSLSEYKNHELVRMYYPVILNKEVQKILMVGYNRYAIEYLENGFYNNYYTVDSFDKFDEDTRKKVWFAVERENRESFSEFILENKNSIPEDISKCIKFSTYKFCFYTDKIDEFLEIVNKICADNQKEFEEYINEFSDDYYSSFPEKISSLAQTDAEYNSATVSDNDTMEIKVSGENLHVEFSGDTI